MSLVDDAGHLRSCVRDAKASGVLFDVGHGSGGFSFAVAEVLLSEGLTPDVISSDLHQLSVLGPGFDLPTTMSKLLTVGMSLPDVIAAATSRAALAIGRQDRCGALAPGRRADIAVLRQRTGELRLFDAYLHERLTADRLTCEMAIAAGQVLPAEPADAPAPWIPTSAAQQSLVRELGTTTMAREPWANRLQGRSDFVPMAITGPPRFALEPEG
jgi:dihydroorotase